MVGVVSAASARDIDFHDRGLAIMQAGFWGVDDSGESSSEDQHLSERCCGIRRDGGLYNVPGEAKCALVENDSEPHVFLAGDKIGMELDMDARTLTMLRNGTPIPSLVFDTLPEQVHVAATVDDEDSEVRLVNDVDE